MNFTLSQPDAALHQKVLENRLQMVKNPVHRRDLSLLHQNEVSSQDLAKTYEGSIEGLVSVLGEDPRWVLSGGLAIPAYTRDFQNDRIHRAIHIGMPSSIFPELVARAISSYHYFPYRRKISIHQDNSWKFDFYEPLPMKILLDPSIIMDEQLRNIRLIPIDANLFGKMKAHEPENLLAYIDIALHDFKRKYTYSNEKWGNSFEGDYYDGSTYTTHSGKKVNLVNLEFIRMVKEARLEKNGHGFKKEKEKNLFDIEKIKALQ